MELGDYLSALVRGWWLIVIFGLVGLAVGLLLPTPNHQQVVSETHWVSTSSFGSTPPPRRAAVATWGAGSAPLRSSTTRTATKS